ncbi:3-keto-disaccharide hydrolase [Gimesia sp.]|uniref:3-keto-disaccharide hydrolase n=1 Tax=Gimesia sp. TaxID=2024833 RepID=UPI003A8FB679
MNRSSFIKQSLSSLLVLCLLGSSAGFAGDKKTAETKNQPPEGFIALFNGKDLSGWIGMNYHQVKGKSPVAVKNMSEADRKALLKKNWEDVLEHWSVEDGELVNDGHGVYLTTAEDYGDFELLLDYKTVAKADSGIYLRGVPQVQIWDTTKEGGKWDRKANLGSGGLFNNQGEGKYPLVHADKPFGEWNHFRIIMKGDKVTVYMNDKLVVDNKKMDNYYEKDKPIYETGPIQLQTHGGEIRFKNVFLKKL